MKYFRHLIAIAVAALCVCGARADDVTREMAIAAADAWVAANPSFGTTGSALTATAEYDGATLMWWTVTTSGGGAIFVAPETSIEPVLAALPVYAGALPAAHPLRAIMSRDVAGRRSANAAATVASAASSSRLLAGATASGTITNAEIAAAVSAAESKWTKYTTKTTNRLLAGTDAPDGVTVMSVVPGFGEGADGYLRFWNQSDYSGYTGVRSDVLIDPCFNLYTPLNAVCGCVATAGAALMQYFGATGLVINATRDCTYKGETVSLTTISATNHYDWSILPQEIGGQESQTMAELKAAAVAAAVAAAAEAAEGEEEAEPSEAELKYNAVVSLLGRATYDAGVCVQMGYTSGESGALLKDLATALTGDFGFKCAKYISIDADSTGDGAYDDIYANLCRTNPVALGIRSNTGGHAILAVGYGEDEEETAYTRLFMGWGGTGDAWYNLPDILSYSLVNEAIVSIALDPPVGHRSVAAAKAAALENNKPVLLLSGFVGDEGTDLLLDYIKSNDIQSQFEIYFADYNADPYGDQKPSYGVFNPLVFNNDTDNRWAFYNGRLSYGTDTNEVVIAEVLEQGLDAWEAAYADYLLLQEASTNGIVVVASNYKLAEYEGYSYYYNDGTWEDETYDNVFTNGQTVTIFSPGSSATNVEEGVAWSCAGCAVYAIGDSGYTAVATADGTNVSFTVTSNTTYEVDWYWEPEAVLIKVWAASDGKGYGVVVPDASQGVWCEYGGTLDVVATPRYQNSSNSQFSHWSGDTNDCEMAGSAISIPADGPREIAAHFVKNGGVTGSTERFTLTIDSDPADVQPTLSYGTRALAYGDNSLLNGAMAVSVPDTWTDSTGGVWCCVGYTGTGSVSSETNESSVAGFTLAEDSTLTWLWEIYKEAGSAEAPIGPVEGGVTNSALVIYSTNSVQMAVETRVSNATAGYWYSIWSANSVTGTYSFVSGDYTGTAKMLVEDSVPDILSLVIVFDPADAAQFYRVVVTEEEPE